MTDDHRRRLVLSNEAGHLFKGMRFVATLQLRTPLYVLLRDGDVCDPRDIPEPDYPQWAGIWSYNVKTFRELGIDIPEPNLPDVRATLLGPLPKAEYLPFLIAFRKIVESSASHEDQVKMINDLAEREDWHRFVDKHGGAEEMMKHGA